MDGNQAEAYATALYSVANAEGQLDAVGDELFAVGQAVDGNDELRNALGDPHLRGAAITSTFWRHSAILLYPIMNNTVAYKLPQQKQRR